MSKTSSGDSRSLAPLVLWVTLAALVGARAVLAFAPGMSGWGLHLLRFVAPVPGWTLWLLSALALVPTLARRAMPWARRAGDAIAGHARGGPPWNAPLALAAAAGITAWWLPDRLFFVGDFLLRHGTAERALEPAALFPQALPLDVLLHYRLPRALAGTFGMDVALGERALGSVEAAALGALAVAFARAVNARGAAALATAIVVLCGGYLGMYTGYGKAMAEMTLLTAGAAVLGLRSTTVPGALLPLGFCLAAALLLHRSALGLLPAGALAWILCARATPGAWRRPAALAGAAVALLALVFMLPRIVTTMLRFDAIHLTPPEVARAGGMLPAAVAGTRLLDLANLVVLLSPLAPAIPPLAMAARSRLRAPAPLLLGAFALPWVAMTLVLHVPQGIYRDWDNFAAAGMALSLVAAWLVAETLRDAPRTEWLALAVVLGALAPSAQWLALHADVERGLRRVEAFVGEPPARSEAERGTTWDFLGIRNAQLGRWDASAAALARAAETAPSPRVLLQWALAEQARGRYADARDLFRRTSALTPGDSRAWLGLAISSRHLHDYDECRRAIGVLDRLRPGDPKVRAMLEDLERVNPTP